MIKDIPKIQFDKDRKPRIEVMDFSTLYGKLNRAKDHDPFSVHKIQFYLILILTKKSYTHFVDFKSYELKEGSALFVAKNQVHHFSRDLKMSEGIAVVFSSLFADQYQFLVDRLKLNRLFNYHIETPIINQKEMGEDNFVDIAYTMQLEHAFPNDFAKIEMLSTLLNVLLLKAERAKEFQFVDGVKFQWLETFSAFKDMLEDEYVITRSSRVYATKLHISYKFLNDIVKKISGRTVKAFIDDFVTIEIKRYLVSTSLSVKEISYKTGFDEPANMVKYFKKNTGNTPLKFRQES